MCFCHTSFKIRQNPINCAWYCLFGLAGAHVYDGSTPTSGMAQNRQMPLIEASSYSSQRFLFSTDTSNVVSGAGLSQVSSLLANHFSAGLPLEGIGRISPEYFLLYLIDPQAWANFLSLLCKTHKIVLKIPGFKLLQDVWEP